MAACRCEQHSAWHVQTGQLLAAFDAQKPCAQPWTGRVAPDPHLPPLVPFMRAQMWNAGSGQAILGWPAHLFPIKSLAAVGGIVYSLAKYGSIRAWPALQLPPPEYYTAWKVSGQWADGLTEQLAHGWKSAGASAAAGRLSSQACAAVQV